MCKPTTWALSFICAIVAALAGCGSDSPDLDNTIWAEDQYELIESNCDQRFTDLIERFQQTEEEFLLRRTSSFGGGNDDDDNTPPPMEPGYEEPLPPEVNLSIAQQLEFYILRRSRGIFGLKYDCDESPGCSDEDAGRAEGKFPEDSFINFGTSDSPCVVSVRGKMTGRLDRSPTEVRYDLELEPADECDFSSCEAVVEARRTQFEQRADGSDCVLDIQCAGGTCFDCSSSGDPLGDTCVEGQDMVCASTQE